MMLHLIFSQQLPPPPLELSKEIKIKKSGAGVDKKSERRKK
jgi:hypothetical protein